MKGIWIAAGLLAIVIVGCNDEDEATINQPSYSTFWVERGSWSVASVPVDDNIDSRRGRLRWWNPRPQDAVPIQDVHPERELNSQEPHTLPSLRLEFASDTSSGPPERSWGGVMRYLGDDYADQTRTQFLEFWLRMPAAPEGRLVIDLGEISEDALPNDTMDTEEIAPVEMPYDPHREYGNGTLEENEDSGLDGVFGVDPLDSARWNGLDQPLVPSWDDWFHAANSSDFSQVNGTEQNRNDVNGVRPNTEDLNGDDVLNLANNYFSYSVALSFDSPFIVGGFDNMRNWRQFRIPLRNTNPELRRSVGTPNFSSMSWMRLYVTGATGELRLEMVEMDLIPEEE